MQETNDLGFALKLMKYSSVKEEEKKCHRKYYLSLKMITGQRTYQIGA